jgi:hypothetical protein
MALASDPLTAGSATTKWLRNLRGNNAGRPMAAANEPAVSFPRATCDCFLARELQHVGAAALLHLPG